MTKVSFHKYPYHIFLSDDQGQDVGAVVCGREVYGVRVEI